MEIFHQCVRPRAFWPLAARAAGRLPFGAYRIEATNLMRLGTPARAASKIDLLFQGKRSQKTERWLKRKKKWTENYKAQKLRSRNNYRPEKEQGQFQARYS